MKPYGIISFSGGFMKFKKRIKKTFKSIIKSIKTNNIHLFLLSSIPFLMLDLFTRIFSQKTAFFPWNDCIPNLFSLIWIYLIIIISLFLKKRNGKMLLIFFFVFFQLFYYINNIYYSLSGTFFDFHLVGLASEGSDYFMDAVASAQPMIYLVGMLSIIFFIFLFRKLPFGKKNNFKAIIFVLIIFLFIHTLIPVFYGDANNELTWNTWRNPRNIYDNFNDNNKSMSITGLYEYTIRNYYLTYLKEKKSNNETELEFLSNIFSEVATNIKNKYTGKLKNKNIIFLQLEGIDDWVLTKKNMPNTYALLSNSINFNNHYSYYNGGGSTFNSEFAVNTGYVTPITYTQNAYTFNKNDFPYSMARIFKELDYRVNAFHMNSGEYYSRKINYTTWGFDNYYGLKDLDSYINDDYKLDTELINNPIFYEKQFLDEGNFVNYLITYTLHMPFSESKGMCKYILAKEKELQEEKEEEIEIEEVEPLTEEECVIIQAKETDEMVKLLMKALKDNDLDDDTIIVAFSDHYLYTLNDQTILDKYKDTKTNLINKTPFFIWSKGLKKVNVSKVTSQINILPTVLNLLGINYNPNYYTGEDALNNNYKGIAFFNDYSWYDGKYYFQDGKLIKGNQNNVEVVEEKSGYVDYLIKKNDLILKYNYLKRVKEAEIESVQ